MIFRIDVRTRNSDTFGDAVRQQISELGRKVGPITTRRIFLIDSDAPADQIESAAAKLLADPIVEHAERVTASQNRRGQASRIEIHLKPGVMDPVASSTEMAMRDMGVAVREVRTGRAYLIEGNVPQADLQHIASRILANGVIESVHFDTYIPAEFARGHEYELKLLHVSIRNLSETELQKLSREGHLFLSLPEMKAIQDYFRKQEREPTDVELETIAQTWSEHCVHKTLKSAVDVYDEAGKLLRSYKNLIKQTIFDSTMTLMERNPGFCLSVFKDNAGVVVFDDIDAVCFKVETHNHPSAIEPYGGSATGAGGVIRDILGTGLAAKPIANTDVFCVAYPTYGKLANKDEAYQQIEGRITESLRVDLNARDEDQITVTLDRATGFASATHNSRPVEASIVGRIAAKIVKSAMQGLIDPLPKGIIHPKRILQQVVAGVRDYGNRMGIPTVNGAVYFDNRYLGNPLVFCGCVGIIPRDKIEKAARVGDAVVVMGGRTGRDGIHGATFSSAELTDTHADEFSHAVQIGNAITEKKVADVVLQARDRGLFSGITDCGAGGLSSAVGEMGEKIGAAIDLDTVPLKYAGLRYDEIWISEAQERMVLSVPKEKLKELLELSASEDVESTVIGTFGTPGEELILHYSSSEVGRLSMDFLHHGIPMPTRKAVVRERDMGVSPMLFSTNQTHGRDAHVTMKERLLSQLAHPNTASKHWIIRQYDHEVQGGSVIKPLIGPQQIGPSDAAVIRPKLDGYRGVALGCGLAPQIEDPYAMAIAAIDEAIRNVVAVGADPAKIAILDNFCWPSVDNERSMGELVRTCEACRDAALAYGIPFISGKDSLHNQFTNSETGEVIRIPNTLLISAMGVIDDVRKCVTMDLKDPREGMICLVEPADDSLAALAAVHRAMSEAIRAGHVTACHDVSEGGYLTTVAEMCIASGFGAKLTPESDAAEYFAEANGRYVVETSYAGRPVIEKLLGLRIREIGRTSSDPALQVSKATPATGEQFELHIFIDDLTKAWRGTLDW